MPFVLDGGLGVIEVVAQNVAHLIEFKVDAIRQAPVINHDIQPVDAKNGTEIRVRWPDSAKAQFWSTQKPVFYKLPMISPG